MFKLSTGDRLSRWKSFRNSLGNFSLDRAIKETNDFWHHCPFHPFYLDTTRPDQWPDPWQLITENYYCDLAKTLGIIYTLHLSDHRTTLFPELHIYSDIKTRYDYHIAYLCKGKYVLNLIEGDIVNKEQINQDLKLKYRYTAIDLQLEQY